MSEENRIVNIEEGARTAFIDRWSSSNLAYRPQFVSNDYREGKKVLSAVEDELQNCDHFMISVAFITMGGIEPLLQTLKELEKKGIPGKILTTDYLTFSEPGALKKLASLKNIELRMYMTAGDEDESRARAGFHTKGYIFSRDGLYRIIIGSSNMTMNALTVNHEWNTKFVSTQQGEMARDILAEFEGLWSSGRTRGFRDFIDEYETAYRIVKEQQRVTAANRVSSIRAYKLRPNTMQTRFVRDLRSLMENGSTRALLVSATGTGKTYAAAFAMRELRFQRVLFVVHRNQICRQAKRSFETVFGNSLKTGLVSGIGGTEKDYQADYVFATVQTLSRPENLARFPRDHFTCTIYDEAHHSAAGSYQRIMDYFKPEFTLGMTATPDRRDDYYDGRNIYEIFDHNIACEIRLQQAMEEELLCPFHYFGITDLAVIADEGRTREEKLENFRYLTGDDRVSYVMEQADYYGHSGDRVMGLIFCSRVEEARELSKKFCERGLKTAALSGEDPEDVREAAVDRLTREIDTDHFTVNEYGVRQYLTAEGEEQDYLDYILTVDIFSEGTDIVEVNQVIMLRPTQSPIVFIQQLGRGLRKAAGKEYVVVLDFIGNYKNNFMIPIALSGDRTYNKDNIRRYLMEGGRVIPGASTVHFDEISRKRIFAAVDEANFSDIRLIKENYRNLKDKLGRIPRLQDFDDYGEMDVLRIFDNASLGSYYKFLVKYEKDYTIRISEDEEQVIEFVSKKLASGKRLHELLMLRRILAYAKRFPGVKLLEGVQQDLKEQKLRQMTGLQQRNVVNVMTNEFPSGAGKKTYEKCVFIERVEDGTDYRPSKTLLEMLDDEHFYGLLSELVEFGIRRNRRDYSQTYMDTDLVLYQKYTYEDVCRLLNWENNEVPLNIGGYKYDKKTKTFPVFINYDKSEDISDTTKYEDHFTSEQTLVAISKSGRSLVSEDVQNFLKAKERGIRVELFVRKNKDDRISKEFYYLGRMEASGKAEEFIMANTDKTAVEIEWILDVPVREDLYQYIVSA